MKKALVAVTAFFVALGFAAMGAAQVQDAEQSNEVTGGDVVEQDVDVDRETAHWAGFFGNLDSTVTLSDDEDNLFYEWTGEDLAGSAVYGVVSEHGVESEDIDSVEAVDSESIEDLEGVPTEGVDSIANTYDADELDQPEDDVAGADTANLETEAEFANFLYADNDTDNNPIFTAETEDQSVSYDGDTEVDFELMAGQEDLDDEQIDFYAEITPEATA